MAIQQWTIIKIVGPSASEAASRFEKWVRARRSSDPSCFSPDDWPSATRREASNLLSQLENHRNEMPIAYFSQHVDQWLAHGQMQVRLPNPSTPVYHDHGGLWCYRLPDRGRLTRRNQSFCRSAQSPEAKWLSMRLIEAAKALDTLWRDAALLINRQSIAPSPTDEELKASAERIPRWMRR